MQLSIPSAGGVGHHGADRAVDNSNCATTALVIGKDAAAIQDLKGQEINLVELSVSHYLWPRAAGAQRWP